MEWQIVKKKIKDLRPSAVNPRKLTKNGYEHLKTSIDKFGLIDKPVISEDGTIIGGHQRVEVLKKAGAKEVECWQPKKGWSLSEKDLKELNVRLNRGGEFDYDALANNYDEDELKDWGFEDWELGFDDEIVEAVEEAKEHAGKCPTCGKKMKRGA